MRFSLLATSLGSAFPIFQRFSLLLALVFGLALPAQALAAGRETGVFFIVVANEDVEGVQVYSDGKYVNTAPCRLEVPAGKTVQVELRHPFFQTYRQSFTARAGETRRLPLQLVAAHPGLLFRTLPGVEISIRAEVGGFFQTLGTSDETGNFKCLERLGPGLYMVLFSKKGYESRERRVELKAGQTSPVTCEEASLSVLPALVNFVGVRPTPDKIFLEGQEVEFDELDFTLEVPVGKSFEKDAYLPRIIKVEKPLEIGEERVLDGVFLQKSAGRLRLLVKNKAGMDMPLDFYSQLSVEIDGRPALPDKNPQLLHDIPTGKRRVTLRHPLYELGDDRSGVVIEKELETSVEWLALPKNCELVLEISLQGTGEDFGKPKVRWSPEPESAEGQVYVLSPAKEYRVQLEAAFHKQKTLVIPPLKPGERQVQKVVLAYDTEAYAQWQAKLLREKFEADRMKVLNKLSIMENSLRAVKGRILTTSSANEFRQAIADLREAYRGVFSTFPEIRIKASDLEKLIESKQERTRKDIQISPF